MTKNIINSNYTRITAKRLKEWEDFKKVIKERKKKKLKKSGKKMIYYLV